MHEDSSTSTIRAGREGDPWAKVHDWVLLAGLSPQAVALYTVLQAHVNHARKDHKAWPGMDTVAKILGFKHRNSVGRYVAELVSAGAIDVERVANSTRRHNIYVVHETPPAEYTGMRSLTEFHDAQKAAEVPTHTVVGIGTHTEMGKNQTKRTRRISTSSDAFTAGGPRTSSQTDRKIFLPKDFYRWDDSGRVIQYLVSAAVAALRASGLEPHGDAADRIGQALRGGAEDGASIERLVESVRCWVERAGSDDPEFGWLATVA
jgi:3-oxoacyl-(acyl-carrier-protein) synthase